MSVSSNLQVIKEQIKASAIKAGRDPAKIRLIAVTKYVNVDLMNDALRAGITDIGENRVQDAVQKFPCLAGDVTKHLIGSLQTNKVKTALANFDLIHSVDRPELIEAIAKCALKMDKRVEILVQLNISAEPTKHGCAPADLPGLLGQINQYPQLIPSGLMTIAPAVSDPETVRPIFRKLKTIFAEVAQQYNYSGWQYLSMGMSQDFQVAVEEGANLLRIGTALFKSE